MNLAAIAWAIVEYLHEHPQFRPKTLFATHYHELNEMEKSFPRICNYNVSVKEIGNKVIFLRKLVKGGSEHSFGIHVAKMAGMPKSVIDRANQILIELEESRDTKTPVRPVESITKKREGYQLSIFQLDDPVLKKIRDEISKLDIMNLTPVEALNKLYEIQKIIGVKK
jgi:DNA mismatch repair protein MutS